MGRAAACAGRTSGSPATGTSPGRSYARRGTGPPPNAWRSPAAAGAAVRVRPWPASPSSTGCRRTGPSRSSDGTTTRGPWRRPGSSATSGASGRRSADQNLDGRRQFGEPLLGVGEVHGRTPVGVQLVVDPGVAVAHGALDDDDTLRGVHIEDRHAGHGVAGAAGGQVHHVVGADD